MPSSSIRSIRTVPSLRFPALSIDVYKRQQYGRISLGVLEKVKILRFLQIVQRADNQVIVIPPENILGGFLVMQRLSQFRCV